MAHKGLFAPAGKAPAYDTWNEAGGKAYAFSAEHALVQYAVTGTFGNTFYASAVEQLETVLDLASKVSAEIVAKTAVYCREKGFMKDVPALLVAYLAVRDVRLMEAVFPRVIDNGKMMRNFVQILRSGVVGRKSLGTAPKRAAQAWFDQRSPEVIFRSSIGTRPSMADVIKLVRPSPKGENGTTDFGREAIYRYLIGKEVDTEKLPPLVQAFESFKASVVRREEAARLHEATKGTYEVPDVPFEMLTALDLTAEHWRQIANRMSWTQTRLNLNALLRHGVFSDPEMVARVANRLRSPELVRRARVFPYQLLAAFRAASSEMPGEITTALQEALEIATENVPAIVGKVYVCPDVSGSMRSPVTGYRGGGTGVVRCVDVAALVAASILRKNVSAEVIPFSDDVVPMSRRLNPFDSVMTNAHLLSSLPSGGTACSAPLRFLNQRAATGDLVVYVSDNQSWSDFRHHPSGRGTRATGMAEEWNRFQVRNPKAKMVLVDVQPNGSTQVQERADVLNIGGFSDAVFEVVSLFAKGETGPEYWLGEIGRIPL